MNIVGRLSATYHNHSTGWLLVNDIWSPFLAHSNATPTFEHMFYIPGHLFNHWRWSVLVLVSISATKYYPNPVLSSMYKVFAPSISTNIIPRAASKAIVASSLLPLSTLPNSRVYSFSDLYWSSQHSRSNLQMDKSYHTLVLSARISPHMRRTVWAIAPRFWSECDLQ